MIDVHVLWWFNVALSAGSLVLLTAVTVRHWDQWPGDIRRLGVWFIVILAIVCYGSGEEALSADPEIPRIRAVLFALALIGLVLNLLYDLREDHRKERF
jgi:hypothetical protein